MESSVKQLPSLPFVVSPQEPPPEYEEPLVECEIYYRGNIFNLTNGDERFVKRQDFVEKFLHKFTILKNQIYENDKITINDNIWYLHLRKDLKRKPIMNIYFKSAYKLNKFLKENKEYMKENYGKIGKEYLMQGVTYAGHDQDSVIVSSLV